MTEREIQIERVRIDLLIPWDQNPRIHGEDVNAIVASIERFGWTNPILAQRGTNRVIAGHGRLIAAKRAGLREVPVIFLALDDDAAGAYTIADNRLPELSRWDFPKLKAQLVELDDGAMDLSAIGFDTAGLQQMVEWQHPEAEAEAHERKPKAKKLKCPKCGHRFKAKENR